MSADNTPDEIRRVEENLYDALKHAFDSRSAELHQAGLHVDLEPISRSGKAANYVSYIEAALRYRNNDVHDVVFFYIAEAGRLVVDETSMREWITMTVDESLKKASEDGSVE